MPILETLFSQLTLTLLAIIVIYVGEKIQQIYLTKVLREALKEAQTQARASPLPSPAPPTPLPPPVPQQPAPVPLAPAPQPAPVPVPQPKPAPATSGPFAKYPSWFQAALHEVGFHETGDNQGIDKYVALAHAGGDGDPWCAIFANAMLESVGVPGTRSASSQSFRSNPNFVLLSGPAPGAIVVFWRISQTSGLGHVGFYRGENASSIWTLGGNEDDMVQIEALPKSSASFGLVGYYWPRTVPLPTIASVDMPAGSPASVKTDPTTGQALASAAPSSSGLAETAITATCFGGQQSAYGGPIDDNSPGVALPYHFSGTRPMVRVINRANGLHVDCQIVDVGPWNINDPYWTSGSRPQAESGFDTTGRKTNKAGIDLTVAANNAIQLNEKGLVDWGFIQQAPSVT